MAAMIELDDYRGPDVPANVEAEMALLGCWILDARSSYKHCGRIEPRAFWHPTHQMIARAMAALFDESVVWDLIILKDRLERDGNLTKVGGEDFLIQVAESPVGVGAVEGYWKIVNENWRWRGFHHRANRLAKLALDRANDDDLAVAMREIDEINSLTFRGQRAPGRFNPDDLGDMRGVQMGIPQIERYLDHRGWPCGHLSVVAGETGRGKSTFALQAVYNLIDDPFSDHAKRVAYISGEMSRDEIFRKLHRMHCGRGKRPTPDGVLIESEYEQALAKWEAATEWVNRADITVMDLRSDFGGRCEIGRAMSWLQAQHRQSPVDVCVVDYFQLFNLEGWRGQRYEEVGLMSKMMMDTAKTLGIPIVTQSQVTINAQGGYQTRDGRQLEDDAALIVDVRRGKDGTGKDAKEDPNRTEVVLRKVRFGNSRVVIPARFDHGRRMLDFENLD
jgi:replicative DNA helicase